MCGAVRSSREVANTAGGGAVEQQNPGAGLCLRLCSRDGGTTMAIFMGVLDAASEDYPKIVTTAALV